MAVLPERLEFNRSGALWGNFYNLKAHKYQNTL